MNKLFIIAATLVFKIYMKFFRNRLEKNARNKVVRNITITSRGFNINLNLDRAVDERFFIGEFEHETLNFYQKIIKPNMIIFDIGANIGIFSLAAAAKMDNKGIIYAFEPADIPYQDFEDNLKINNFKNINIYKLGIADREGEVSFNICEDDAYNSIGASPMDKIVKNVTIPIISLDFFCEKNQISKVHILKIDTEGAELLALKGANKLFSAENAPILLCEYNILACQGYEHGIHDFEEALIMLGYHLYYLRFGVLTKLDEKGRKKASDIICLKSYHFTDEFIRL